MEWISIKDSLPEIPKGEKTSDDVIAWAKSTHPNIEGEWIKTIAWYKGGGKWSFIAEGLGNTYSEVSHWMNPEPPKE